MISLKKLVIECLEKYPETRNNDITLTLKLWYNFYNQHIFSNERSEQCIKLDDLYLLPTQDSIKRIRAALQNNKKNPRFLPTNPEVIKKRQRREEQIRSDLGYNPELRTITTNPYEYY